MWFLLLSVATLGPNSSSGFFFYVVVLLVLSFHAATFTSRTSIFLRCFFLFSFFVFLNV